jgi:uncharacterized protein YndB with AHSA1/START domain
LDLRPGGSFDYALKSPDGDTMWGKFVFREIAPPEKLVFMNSFSDEAGGVTRHPMAPAWPLHMLTTVSFEDVGGKTRFTVRWAPYEATAEELQAFEAGRPSMTQGWSGTMDQLAAYLAKAQ